ncbi:hypothetical protein LEL_09619 [Akanthomyces lecanii RCEF 1005]|uniref:Uncharacterized protein n=1 Tax=Akanthomyces lecanii RCEF 1005 TaxID=1081108 RepID=A0A168C793_CORDF|nr:hypothetical protein LEL_09619 [Akanthomyces lecanii RCEF 1005]
MSDNTSQRWAGLFRFPELDTFRIVKDCVTESHLAQYSKVPGLSEEQHKKLLEALQAVVKAGKLADLKAVMAAMTREESNKIYACFKEADRKLIAGFSVNPLLPGAEAVTMRALHAQLAEDHAKRRQHLHKQRQDLEKREGLLGAEASSLEDTLDYVCSKFIGLKIKDREDLEELLAALGATDPKMEDLVKRKDDMVKRREGYDAETEGLEMKLRDLERESEKIGKEMEEFNYERRDLTKKTAELDQERVSSPGGGADDQGVCQEERERKKQQQQQQQQQQQNGLADSPRSWKKNAECFSCLVYPKFQACRPPKKN